ncbi:MAG: hypothetical protein AAFQ15_17375 [Pseudomonadota bacterium]
MKVRKRLSAKKRLQALCYGAISIAVALMIAQHAEFQWSGPLAFVIGLFGVGGVYRCIAGYDEV